MAPGSTSHLSPSHRPREEGLSREVKSLFCRNPQPSLQRFQACTSADSSVAEPEELQLPKAWEQTVQRLRAGSLDDPKNPQIPAQGTWAFWKYCPVPRTCPSCIQCAGAKDSLMENQGVLLDAVLPHSSWDHPQPQTVSAAVQGGVGRMAGMAGSIYTSWSTLCSSQSSKMRASTMPNPALKTETEIHLLC